VNWLQRKCNNCGQTSEAMRFKVGPCEGQLYCPNCGSDKGTDLPAVESSVERYIVAEKPPPVVPAEYQARIIEWAAADFNRRMEQLHGTPVRLTTRGALVGAMKYAFESLTTVIHMEQQKKKRPSPKKRGR
jgi:uncharacterized Zn finger protein (UPF0148 family)